MAGDRYLTRDTGGGRGGLILAVRTWRGLARPSLAFAISRSRRNGTQRSEGGLRPLLPYYCSSASAIAALLDILTRFTIVCVNEVL